jgi:hypothetical protein
LTDYISVHDYELEDAFAGTNFGPNPDKRNLVAECLLKIQANYSPGHTITEIVIELGMLTRKGNITKRGRRFMYYYYSYATVPQIRAVG